MKAQKQKAERTPQSLQVDDTNKPVLWKILLGPSLASQGAHLTAEERLTAVRLGIMRMTEPDPFAETHAKRRALVDAYETRTKTLDRVFASDMPYGSDEPGLCIGRDPQTGQWFKVTTLGSKVVERELTFAEALCGWAEAHKLADAGYHSSTTWDDHARVQMLAQAADAIASARPRLPGQQFGGAK